MAAPQEEVRVPQLDHPEPPPAFVIEESAEEQAHVAYASNPASTLLLDDDVAEHVDMDRLDQVGNMHHPFRWSKDSMCLV